MNMDRVRSVVFRWCSVGCIPAIFFLVLSTELARGDLPQGELPQGELAKTQEKKAATNQDSTQQSADNRADGKQDQSGKKHPERETAKGVVFVDVDKDGKLGDADIVQPGVHVSNGVDIVTTDSKGRYEIEVDDDSIVFIIKPRGRRTAVDKNNLPQFYYIHKPNGSPPLRFPGVKPTGQLPESINFPLYQQDEPEKFETIVFADPQARNKKELDYIAHDVVEDLVGTNAKFGVTLGDILFDDLSLFDAHNQTVAMVGIPWFNVLGNHDINFDAKSRRFVNETFERHYGPSYYSFDYGQVHFVLLDNIDWIVPDDDGAASRYVGNFGKTQLQWLEKDLKLIDEKQMVVLLMHIPIQGCGDAKSLYRLIEKRPLCISMSGHTHYHAHQFLGKEEGWNGADPHHHIINVTVSGSWWAGQKDERGIPHATMADGAPNGYSVLSFDGDKYQIDFRAAGRDKNYQMEIYVEDEIKQAELGQAPLVVNVFNGSEKTHVEMRIDNRGDWRPLTQKNGVDPAFAKLRERELQVKPIVNPALPKPYNSTHIWAGSLPKDLAPGHHLITIRATDRNGRVFQDNQIVRVVAASKGTNGKRGSKKTLPVSKKSK